jgi:hypothetical protein
MLNKLPILKYFTTSLTNHAFRSFKDPSVGQQLEAAITDNKENKDKLDALTNVIFSLSHLEVQYLVALQNEQRLAMGARVSDGLVMSFSDQKPSAIEYLYQKRWMG